MPLYYEVQLAVGNNAGVLELRYSFRESETEARPDLGFRIARSIN